MRKKKCRHVLCASIVVLRDFPFKLKGGAGEISRLSLRWGGGLSSHLPSRDCHSGNGSNGSKPTRMSFALKCNFPMHIPDLWNETATYIQTCRIFLGGRGRKWLVLLLYITVDLATHASQSRASMLLCIWFLNGALDWMLSFPVNMFRGKNSLFADFRVSWNSPFEVRKETEQNSAKCFLNSQLSIFLVLKSFQKFLLLFLMVFIFCIIGRNEITKFQTVFSSTKWFRTEFRAFFIFRRMARKEIPSDLRSAIQTNPDRINQNFRLFHVRWNNFSSENGNPGYGTSMSATCYISLVWFKGLGGGTREAGGGEGGREEGGRGGGGGAGVQARPLGIPQHHPAGRQGL